MGHPGFVEIRDQILIEATPDQVWSVLESRYPDWARVFCSSARYEGEWKLGETVRFVGQTEDGSMVGQVGRVAEVDPRHRIVFAHFGIVLADGRTETEGEALDWVPSRETYTLTPTEGNTTLVITHEVNAEYVEPFQKMWRAALAEIRRLAE